MTTVELSNAAADPASIYGPGVSIIVCTYNRLELLRRFVDSVLPQLPADFPVEVLIVDNNSSDGTAAYATALADQHPNISYYRELKQGLSHARNGGAAAANYAFLLYCDDDSFLPPHFVKAVGDALAQNNPDLFGGPCLPHYADPRPSWFPEWLEVRRKASTSGFYNAVTLSGSNFGIRRDVLQRLGGFDPKFGMTGKRPGMLEERLVIESYRRTTPADQQKVYYSVEAYVYHHTPASRMRFGFQVRRIYQANFSLARYLLGQGTRTPRLFADRAAARLAAEIGRFAALIPTLLRERRTRPERAMSEFIRVVYRTADFNGARAALRDLSKAKKRKKPLENRALRVAALVADHPDAAPGQKRQLEVVIEHLQTVSALSVHSIYGAVSDEVHGIVDQLGPHNLDVILTDSPNVAFALRNLRTNAPHIQILLWARAEKSFLAALRPWRMALRPDRFLRQLGRLRSAARNVDQVIWSISRRTWLTRLLLGPRAWLYVPNAPKGALVIPPACVKGWTKVLQQAALWAPQRGFGALSDKVTPKAHRELVAIGLFVNDAIAQEGDALERLVAGWVVRLKLEQHAVAGLNGESVRELVEAVGLVVAIVTDSPDVVLALRPLQEQSGHLQITLWARRPKQFAPVLRPWSFWRNPLALKRHLSRLRWAASIADELCWSLPGEKLAKPLLGSANWRSLPLNAPADAAPAREAA